MYGQVNDIDLIVDDKNICIILIGTEEVAFYNTEKKEKTKRIKVKGTAGRISLDSKYFIYAEGNDWCEGINDLKKNTKPKIEAVKFSQSEFQSLLSKS